MTDAPLPDDFEIPDHVPDEMVTSETVFGFDPRNDEHRMEVAHLTLETLSAWSAEDSKKTTELTMKLLRKGPAAVVTAFECLASVARNSVAKAFGEEMTGSNARWVLKSDADEDLVEAQVFVRELFTAYMNGDMDGVEEMYELMLDLPMREIVATHAAMLQQTHSIFAECVISNPEAMEGFYKLQEVNDEEMEGEEEGS